jgi:hypothetical protein
MQAVSHGVVGRHEEEEAAEGREVLVPEELPVATKRYKSDTVEAHKRLNTSVAELLNGGVNKAVGLG